MKDGREIHFMSPMRRLVTDFQTTEYIKITLMACWNKTVGRPPPRVSDSICIPSSFPHIADAAGLEITL